MKIIHTQAFNSIIKMIIKVFIVILILTISQASLADATLSYKTSDGTLDLLLKNKQILVKNIDRDTDLLFNQTANNVIVIQHAQKSYSLLDEAELNNINNQISGLQSAITGNLSAEQHDQLNQILGGALGSQKQKQASVYSLKQAGGAQVGNFVCQQSQVLKDNQGAGSVCAASAKQLNLNQNDFSTLMALQAFALKAGDILGESVSSFTKVEIPNFNQVNLFEFLIYSKLEEQPEGHFHLQKIDTSVVNANFSVPSNYKPQKLVSASNLIQ